MRTPKLLVLLRHGESLMNTAEHSDGRFVLESAQPLIEGMSDLDIPLTALGFRQATAVGKTLRERFEFDVVYQSDQRRSIRTAEGVLRSYARPFPHPPGPEVRQTFLLNERNNGYTFGMTREQAMSAFPWLEEYWERWGWFQATPPGGESVAALTMLRTVPFLNRLNGEAAGQRILVVGHGRWIQSARVHLEGLPTDTKEPPLRNAYNCGWVVYVNDPETDRLVLADGSRYRVSPETE
ncbi:MAG TPA: histidine phosphatase family protein [Candidatus Paceibacterota bacterium]|nr:histidine phosphatase family protein [Candidatus Paceibacterota bacterium]